MAKSKQSTVVAEETIDTTPEVVDFVEGTTGTVEIKDDSIVAIVSNPSEDTTPGHHSRDFFTGRR